LANTGFPRVFYPPSFESEKTKIWRTNALATMYAGLRSGHAGDGYRVDPDTAAATLSGAAPTTQVQVRAGMDHTAHAVRNWDTRV
jgi:hypothetical protein